MKHLLSGIAALALIAGCQQQDAAPAETHEASAEADITTTLSHVETLISDDTYTLSWTYEAGNGPVSIAVTTDADATTGAMIAENLTDTSFSWTPEGGIEGRHYFIITPASGDSVMTASRLLPLEGGRNFRDLGGYETEDGHTVRWGELYRSGVMASLTENDYEYLSSLGIRVICDFRALDERTSEPTNWAAGEIEYLTFVDEQQNSSFMGIFANADATPQDVRDAFGGAYLGIAQTQSAAYETMFDRLAAGDAPLTFNCSAGKDRTGVAAALLLTVLGVPRETVVHDYQLSDDYVDFMGEFLNEEARARAMEENPGYAFMFQQPEEMIAPILSSYPEYIERFFTDVEAEYGDVMSFVEQELNVTPEEITAIRARYLN